MFLLRRLLNLVSGLKELIKKGLFARIFLSPPRCRLESERYAQKVFIVLENQVQGEENPLKDVRFLSFSLSQ